LARSLAERFGTAEARLAVIAVATASPLLYYSFVQPLMSHGLTFAFAALCVAFTLRAERDRSLAAWCLSGACLGLAMLCRAQSAPLALFLLAGLWRSRAGWKAALSATLAASALFLPQPVVWKLMYGSLLTIPQGSGFVDWTGRHAVDVLISADRGLFNWHPLLLLGLAGLLLALRGSREYGVAALGVLSFTAYLNGSVRDSNASGAFGGRRFDLVLPLLAFGLAVLLRVIRPVLEKSPLLLPALGATLAFAWNVSLIDGLSGRPAAPLPLEDLARLQAVQARRAADATLGWLGPGVRNLIYRSFVGVFAYQNYRPGGDFNLADLEPRFLKAGWSDVQIWDDRTAFRYLLFPEACIIIPLDEPFDIRGFIRARSPARIKEQRLTIVLNGRRIAEAELPSSWTEIPFTAPRAFWRRGENDVCIRAARKRPGDEAGDLAFAAAVERVQLP
ncbi:MAG: glycosyltransferase family 39 protein, partial [Vicinamibacteria bacterium]|nr:glycosyltransferase family 39 protein [Vicinamibacteria bacterium]